MSAIIKRSGSEVWQGGLGDGKGLVSTESRTLENVRYSFDLRFSDQSIGKGTNPEELIAAAHAACFSMALSGQLQKVGLTPEAINTTASLTLEKLKDTDGGWTITAVHLEVQAQVPGAEQVSFDRAAAAARAGCPVSKLLKAPVTMNTQLISTDTIGIAG